MVSRAKVLLALALASLAGCIAPQDPCPPGSVAVESQDRCVARDSTMLPDASIDAGTLRDGSAPADGATIPDRDAEPELDAHTPDAAGQDAASIPDSSNPPLCSDADVKAWKSFHEREDLVTQLDECSLMGCIDQSCPAQACVRARAGVVECGTCPEAEGECVRVHCFLACGSNGDARECLACACEAGCIDRFEACAESDLGLCAPSVYGRPVEPSQAQLSGPILLRMKPDTGALQPSRILPGFRSEGFLSTDHLSTGFGLIKSFARAGRSYVIQHKNACADTPCVARISPLSSEGVLGRPVYAQTWSQGWDRVTTFLLGTDIYLVRYKTGQIPAQSEPKGHLRIERMVFNAAGDELTLEPALDQQATPVFEPAWSALEAFAIGATPYLVSYGTDRAGELTFWRLTAADGKVTRSAVSSGLSWPRGYDVLDAFQSAGRWYLAAYASGRANVTQVASGQGLIVEPVLASANLLTLSPPLFEGDLGAGVTHLVGFTSQNTLAILRVASGSGAASIATLPADPDAFQSQPWTTTYTGSWSTSPPWKLVELVDPNPWGTL